jgi:hypothetical protein
MQWEQRTDRAHATHPHAQHTTQAQECVPASYLQMRRARGSSSLLQELRRVCEVREEGGKGLGGITKTHTRLSPYPQHPAMKPIHEAARDGDLAEVNRLLEEDGQRLSAQTPHGTTPLMDAAGRGAGRGAAEWGRGDGSALGH